MSDKNLSDQELIELENALDDGELLQRIRNVVMGDVHPDVEGETAGEQAIHVLKTIVRQLRSRTLSLSAQGYLAHCLERFIDGRASSLDRAFYLVYDRRSDMERDVVKAYRSIIRQRTKETDPDTGLPIYKPVSKAIHREAKQAALQAYCKATGRKDDLEPEKRIHQTITPMLARLRVLMPEEKSKSK